MQIVQGTYTGNGSSSRPITGAPFGPDFVLVKGNSTANPVCKTNTMGSGSKQWGGTSFAAGIGSLNADGFTVDASGGVNASGVEYDWLAIEEAVADCKMISYTGNGVNGRSVTGVGFQPDLVIVHSAAAVGARWRLSIFGANNSLPFGSGGVSTTGIQSEIADGFTVGTNLSVNGSGVGYHAACFKLAANFAHITYTGDGTDNRNITGVGLNPDWALVKNINDQAAFLRFRGQTGDASFSIGSGETVNGIQAFISDGIQVGSGPAVNASGVGFRGFAFTGAAAAARAWIAGRLVLG